MKKSLNRNIEAMSIDEFIERELKTTTEELTKMGYFKKQKENGKNKRDTNNTN